MSKERRTQKEQDVGERGCDCGSGLASCVWKDGRIEAAEPCLLYSQGSVKNFTQGRKIARLRD